MEGRAAGFEMTKAFLALSLFACGGDPGVQQPTRPPPSEVLAMQIHVNGGGGEDTFCPALETGLVRSNLAVTNDSAADATITCRVFVSEDTGLFRVTYNGQTKMKFTVRVEVRSAQNNTVVDTFLAEYTGYRNNAPDEDVVSKTVLGFAYSPRIAAFARAVKVARASGTVTAQPTAVATVEQPPPSNVDRRDDADWFAIDTVKCKIPARVEACDSVRRYLQRHPSGAHAQEANELLAAAQPALEKLQKDDVAWQKSNHSECSRARNADACVGVEAYSVQFPTGAHIDEAHRLLRSAGVEK